MHDRDVVLVTGSTGLIGRAVVDQLRSDGRTYRHALRTAREIAGPAVVVGEIGRATDWTAALAGVDTVIHIAGLAHRRGATSDDLFEANARGAGTLARAALARGVRRFVLLSTIKVNGDVSPPSGFQEGDAPAPADDYARSKKAAEDEVREAGARGLSFTIVRTPLVYGPGVKANFLALMRAVDRRLPLPLGRAASNRRTLIYSGNLASALIHLADHPAAAGQMFLVGDAESVSTRELVIRIAAALGREPRLISVPPAVLAGAAMLIGRRSAVSSLFDSAIVTTSHIARLTGWRPPVVMREGLARTAAWYRATFPSRS